jgi:hypothetical protein
VVGVAVRRAAVVVVGAHQEIAEFVYGYTPPDPDLAPRRVRVSYPTLYGLYEEGVLPRSVAEVTVTGLHVSLDHSLPPGVWRVCAADGRLIRDSRSTNKVRP